MEKLLKTHSFCFNPGENGGEGLYLTTKFYDNGDGEIFYNQELTLQSYYNSASINLDGSPLTSDFLRKLANELDETQSTLQSLLDRTK